MRPYADATEARIDRQNEQAQEAFRPTTPLEEWIANQPERDAINAQHRIDMRDPAYAAAHEAAIIAKIRREGPSSGRISRRYAQDFESPIGSPALKTSEQLRAAELARIKSTNGE